MALTADADATLITGAIAIPDSKLAREITELVRDRRINFCSVIRASAWPG